MQWRGRGAERGGGIDCSGASHITPREVHATLGHPHTPHTLKCVALLAQTNDLPTQLHYALFERCGGKGYVLKPPELRQGSDSAWPPFRPMLRRVSIDLLSLHGLLSRREARPQLAEGERHGCHAYVPELSGRAVPPEPSKPRGAVSSPSLTVELFAIGGFCCVSSTPTPSEHIATSFETPKADLKANGKSQAASFGRVHCLAAEPAETILRIGVKDGEHEVAYETAVLGVLRRGYRCFQMRSRLGTRIQMCHVLVHIEIGEEPNTFMLNHQLREIIHEKQAVIDEQARRISDLTATIARMKDGARASGGKEEVMEAVARLAPSGSSRLRARPTCSRGDEQEVQAEVPQSGV